MNNFLNMLEHHTFVRTIMEITRAASVSDGAQKLKNLLGFLQLH